VPLGTTFTNIDNDGADAVIGTFNGLPEGATVHSLNGLTQISYVGGDGNDVTLTTFRPVQVLEAGILGGNGNGMVDANECNHLNLVLTNISTSTLSNISVRLSSPTPGVMITQPRSTYPAIPGNGTRTNTTPFQISTLPAFVCGTPIQLDLGIATFTIPSACQNGGGPCLFCPGIFTGSITNTDLGMRVQFNLDGIPGDCDSKECLAVTNTGPVAHYDVYQFTNSGGGTCVTVSLESKCGNGAPLISAAYYGPNFNPLEPCDNFLYLTDIGSAVLFGETKTYICDAEDDSVFTIVVGEDQSGAGLGCTNYTLTVSGLVCPPPALRISRAATNKVVLDWPTSGAGYLLESTPALPPAAWSPVTNEPIVIAPNYNVTNNTSDPKQFYRLRKP
jgi:hypothetical protein